MRLLFIILICTTAKIYSAERIIIYNDTLIDCIELSEEQIASLENYDVLDFTERDDTITVKYRRLKAIIITLLTGPLGGHRIYLGTKPVVPVLYSMTLGGGIFVTVVDLFHLIFARDLSRFENNDKFFMWIEE